jgi:putative transposase
MTAEKKVKGRKRHIVVDTLGMLLKVKVHEANINDKKGGKLLLYSIKDYFSRLKKIFADGGYIGIDKWVYVNTGLDFEVIKRTDNDIILSLERNDNQFTLFDDLKENCIKVSDGFQILPFRWIVERTFSWFNKFRRLSKDYERVPSTTESFCYISMIRLMLNRLTNKSKE